MNPHPLTALGDDKFAGARVVGHAIAVLEARIAALEQELRQIRAEMTASGEPEGPTNV